MNNPMKKKKLGILTMKTTIIEVLEPNKLDKQSTRQAEERICELKARSETDHQMQDKNIVLETRKTAWIEEVQYRSNRNSRRRLEVIERK